MRKINGYHIVFYTLFVSKYALTKHKMLQFVIKEDFDTWCVLGRFLLMVSWSTDVPTDSEKWIFRGYFRFV